MFAEPSPTNYDVRFSLGNIPVRVHPLFWVMAVLLGWGGGDPKELLIWVAVVFVSILVHEMGHAIVARSYGHSPWITLWAFGGLCSYQPSRYDPGQQIMISFAGPMAGFTLAGLVVGGLVLSGHQFDFFGWSLGRGDGIVNNYLRWMVGSLLFVNIFWGVVNLFPVMPLDGGQITRHLLAQFNPGRALPIAYAISTLTGAALAAGALVGIRDFYLAIFFGFLAYNSFTMWQAYSSGGRW